jgi:hypothetical protein
VRLTRSSHSARFTLVALLVFALALTASPAGAHHPDDGLDAGLGHEEGELGSNDPHDRLDHHDASRGFVSEGPAAKVTKNLAVAGRGERLVGNATTDVWAHEGYAYIGTYNDPCGTGENFRSDAGPVTLVDDVSAPGVPIFDVENPNKPRYVGNLPSVEGSRINDVKVARMNSGDILVHSNERCTAAGPGGFEVYDVSDPRNPEHLASVRVDDANQVLRSIGVVDLGVHNLFLFTQGDRDFVAMQTHAEFGGFQIYELTDPTDPQFVSAWGAEYLCEGAFCSDDPHAETDFDTILDVIFDWMRTGYGTSQNKYLHDVTVSDDGTLAYLSHWDAGLVLLDISDPADPQVVSVAIDPDHGSLDGEVNSHAAWPTADGSVVVETEEDFDAWEPLRPLANVTFGDWATNAIPGVGTSTTAGDAFEANQTGNVVSLTADAITVLSGPLAGEVFPAVEFAGSQPKLRDDAIEAEAVWAGRACNTDLFADPSIDTLGIVDPLPDLEDKIAVVRRGACSFASKLHAVQAAGAVAIVVANNLTDSTPWGGVRIWDYSDPENPVLASTFDTVCSAASEPIPGCDPNGTYSVHNVIVEGNLAYFSWYSDGVLIVDISDPYNPVEVARYHEAGPEFEERNAGIQDVWGIYKEPGEPWIYASDRNGGLYVLKTYGGGSARRGKP